METMTRREELESIFWDMYKDAYGFRPRGISTHLWDEAKFNREFDFLQSEITKNEDLRKIAEHEACHAFEMRVQSGNGLRCQRPCYGPALDPRGRRHKW